MTELRDARFQKALEAAPDAAARPPQAIAESIRAAARNTPAPRLTKAVDHPWWKRLWWRTGQPRAPWGAALATVLLGVLVTALWIDQPLPDAQPVASAPLRTPLPATVPLAVPTEAAPKAQLPKAMPIGPREDRLALSPKSAAKTAETAVSQAASQSAGIPPPPASAVATPPAPAPMALADSAHVVTESLSSVGGVAAPTARRAAVDSMLDALDGVDITLEGRNLRADAFVARRLYTMARSLEPQLVPVTGTDGPAAEPTLLLQFRVQGEVVATLTLHDQFARWSRQGRVVMSGKLGDAYSMQLIQAAREAPSTDTAR